MPDRDQFRAPAARKLDLCRCEILHAFIACEIVDASRHALHIAAEPAQHVNIVDRMFEQGPRAGEGPVFPPLTGVVPLNREELVVAEDRRHQPADRFLFSQPLEHREDRRVSQDQSDACLHVRRFHRCHHLFDIRLIRRQRLLTEDVLPLLRRSQHEFLVRGRWYANIDNIDLR